MLPEKNEMRLLSLAAILYVVLALLFWPPVTTTMDESAYLNFAYVLRQGTFYSDVAHVTTTMYITAGEHFTIKYPPGMSLYLASLSFLGWPVVMGANILVHLTTFFVVGRLLRHVGASALFALLFLFHPTAVIYSRTLMSDPLGGLAVAVAFLAHIRARPLLAGLVLGTAVLVKTANGIVVPLAILGILIEELLPWRRCTFTQRVAQLRPVIFLVLGALPGIIVAYLYQKIIQQGGWAKYDAGSGELSDRFNLTYFMQHFPFYILATGLIFPGMVAAPIFYRKKGCWFLRLAILGIILFYSPYFFLDATNQPLESFIIGQRFLLAILPLFIVAYGKVLTDFLAPRLSPRQWLILAVVTGALLFLGTGAVHWRHQKMLRTLESLRSDIGREVPEAAELVCTAHIGKLLHPAWTGRRLYDSINGEEDGLKVISQRLSVGSEPVYLALWSREYRAETPREQALWKAVHERFKVRDVPDRSHDGLQLTQILAEKLSVR
ncbi:MAG: hypothetical protein NTX57_16095 [Armatimonadetes bacterium]|nr:hypothetical protein [Armatimonadota bacterium]